MTLEKLDLIDRRTLSELDKDARISYSELGKKIRVAKETVKYRIMQLQKQGIIRGFYTVINFSRLGFILNRLYIRLQNTNPTVEKEITDYLIKSKNVAVFYRINGAYHLALGVWARDNQEHEQFWLDVKNRFGEYLSDYHLSLMTEYIEFSRLYLLNENGEEGEKTHFYTISKSEPEKLDELDFKLLNFLSNNARASLVEIAKRLDVSIVTVRYRLKNLTNKKIIIGFRTIFDLNNLGKEYYKVDLWLKKFEKEKEVRQHILSHPNVIYTEHTLVTSDIEFDVEVENFGKFIEIMDSFKAKFPEEIRDYTYYSLIRNYKTSYAPAF